MTQQDLRKAGLKVTGPRIKILALLENADNRHLSAEEIYKALLESGEEVGLATVYRVLTQFEQAGLITRHNFEGGVSVFELEHDEHHDHLVCERCGKVVEFVDEVIEQHQAEIAKQYSFQLTEHSLILYGICGDCS